VGEYMEMGDVRAEIKRKLRDNYKAYHLIAYDDSIGLELFRHPMITVLAFVDE